MWSCFLRALPRKARNTHRLLHGKLFLPVKQPSISRKPRLSSHRGKRSVLSFVKAGKHGAIHGANQKRCGSVHFMNLWNMSFVGSQSFRPSFQTSFTKRFHRINQDHASIYNYTQSYYIYNIYIYSICFQHYQPNVFLRLQKIYPPKVGLCDMVGLRL